MNGHKVAMLGTGLIGDFYTMTIHGPRGRDEVAVAYSRSEDRGRAFAERWSIPEHTTSMEEAINHPEIDVVVIGLPNFLHEEAVTLAAEAGKAVLCTKPLGRNADERQRSDLEHRRSDAQQERLPEGAQVERVGEELDEIDQCDLASLVGHRVADDPEHRSPGDQPRRDRAEPHEAPSRGNPEPGAPFTSTRPAFIVRSSSAHSSLLAAASIAFRLTIVAASCRSVTSCR